MIRHAPETVLFPVDPLPVPVIELSFRAVLVFPVGEPHLVAPHPAAAPLSAVDLPPVAAPADVEHRPATRASAKQLDPCHFAGHTPHDSIAACEPCRVGGDAGGIDSGLGDVRKWADRIGRKYERGNHCNFGGGSGLGRADPDQYPWAAVGHTARHGAAGVFPFRRRPHPTRASASLTDDDGSTSHDRRSSKKARY